MIDYRKLLIEKTKPDLIRVVAIVKSKKPKIQILEAKPNYELVSRVVEDAYNAIRFARGDELTRDELDRLIFKENYYSFTSDEEDVKKIVGDVQIKVSDGKEVKSIPRSIFG